MLLDSWRRTCTVKLSFLLKVFIWFWRWEVVNTGKWSGVVLIIFAQPFYRHCNYNQDVDWFAKLVRQRYFYANTVFMSVVSFWQLTICKMEKGLVCCNNWIVAAVECCHNQSDPRSIFGHAATDKLSPKNRLLNEFVFLSVVCISLFVACETIYYFVVKKKENTNVYITLVWVVSGNACRVNVYISWYFWILLLQLQRFHE